MEFVKKDLEEKGYCIVPDILSSDEIEEGKQLFYDWQKTIPNHDLMHSLINPHGIYKFHQVGHQEHAWFIRTRPKIIDIFKYLWGCDELSVSFDGSNYIPKNCTKGDRLWTHTDQAPNKKGVHCYQGLVSLTDNKERTLVVYEGSHKEHAKYFEERDIRSSNDWFIFDDDIIKNMEAQKRVLNIPKGSLVIWDSRTFHQNQYGAPNSEERMVQYVCYLPKNDPKNTVRMREKHLKYFYDLRTTTHWPYPITVVPLQPQTYGDKSKLIDYDLLRKPDLERFMPEIEKLL